LLLSAGGLSKDSLVGVRFFVAENVLLLLLLMLRPDNADINIG
jgi:hypothetical protein